MAGSQEEGAVMVLEDEAVAVTSGELMTMRVYGFEKTRHNKTLNFSVFVGVCLCSACSIRLVHFFLYYLVNLY